jgi:aminoglycoside phosphotransferase (APT) family kinase protein
MAQSDLDPRAILEALGAADGVTAVTSVSGGWDTAIWRVERGGATYALRVFRPQQARIARREAVVMRAGIPGVPIPALHAEGTWRERPAVLIGWCAGRNLLDALRAEPRRFWSLARAFGAMQARLHAAPAPAELAVPGRSWMDWEGSADAALAARLRTASTGPDSILHFDYHPLNVMVADGRVTGVIDWANVQIGDRRADLARTLTILRLAPVEPGTPAALFRFATRLLEPGWRRGYRAVAGPIGGMAPFYAWAGTLMANDLAPKIGRPGIWLQPHHLEPMHRWAAHWRDRAGIS